MRAIRRFVTGMILRALVVLVVVNWSVASLTGRPLRSPGEAFALAGIRTRIHDLPYLLGAAAIRSGLLPAGR